MAKSTAQLKKLAKLAGFDADALVGEIADEVAKKLPPTQSVDVAGITQDVADQVSAKFSGKMAEILEAVKSDGGGTDTKGLIEGVAKMLQPQLMAAIREASEATFRANAEGIITRVNQGIEERLKKNLNDGEEGAAGVPVSGGPGSPRGGLDIGNLVTTLLGNADKIKELVDAFRPPRTPNEIIGQQIGNIFRWHQTLKRLESGQATVEEIEKGFIDLNKGSAQQ